MAIRTRDSLIHWNYFLVLEEDLLNSSRYVEFNQSNFSTYSIEFAHLLLASSSEVDVIAKEICQFLEPGENPSNINQYREIIKQHIPYIHQERVYATRFGLNFRPWSNWENEENPLWWRSYNNVKHERNTYFQDASLKNVLNSLGGLLIFVFHFYRIELQESEGIENFQEIMSRLRPKSQLLSLSQDYYQNNQLQMDI